VAGEGIVIAAEVSRLLGELIDQLVADLLPGGRREGAEWRCGSTKGEAGGSLAVRLTGERRGLWQDWATGQGGDALDLVRAALGLGTADAVDWARRWLGIDCAAEPRHRFNEEPAPGLPVAASRNADPDAVRQARALEIWRNAIEDIASTPAEVYLCSRALDPAKLYSLHGPGRWPATLRYSERAAGDPSRQCRALIVAVHSADSGLVRSVQRILLHSDGSAVRDERGRRRKLSLGPITSNSAMFDYWPDPAGRWGLAEGVESALAAYQLTQIPTWAALGADNMPNIAPPSWSKHATIFADRDKPGMAAAGEALRRLRKNPQIETVRVIGALAEGGDAADVLIAGGWHAR
jgi:hypothetical protein